MEGKVLHQAFVNYRSIQPIDTWGHEVYSNGSSVKPDPWLNQIAINQLVELGYIDAPEGGVSKNIDKCVNDSQHYLAKAYLDGRKYLDAYNIIKPLYDLNKDVPRYALTFILCCDNLKKYEEAFSALELLKVTKGASHINFALVEGELLLNQGKLLLAVEKFRRAIEKNPQNAFAHYHLGNCYRKLFNNSSSESAYLQALSIDETNAAFYSGLAQCYFHQERYEESITVALNAINLSFNIPHIHSLIGESFFRMKKYYEAAGSFELYLKMVPSNLKIRKKLISIYQELKMPIKETEHSDLLQSENEKKHITIVSGLPRSGTSMMMQMLHEGGLDIISDKERLADAHNPHGYFEFEQVKSLHKDNTWLGSVQGKGVIKIVAPQIFHLPPRYRYKIIFMRRDLDEILHSQQKMTGKKLLNPSALRNAYSNTLIQFEKFSKEPNIDVLFTDYIDFVSGDKEKIFECLNKITEFLDEDLDLNLMYECIDRECYRSKSRDILQEF
jgi:tetratricopeptide (TPR) repeat protein